MTWLLTLYPPAWRRRYGQELADLLATQPASFSTAIDLVAGAIDAWVNPQSSTRREGDRTMLAKTMQLRCAGYGPTVTSADVWKSVGVTLGGTVVLTLLWAWANHRYDNPFVESLGLMTTFQIPLLAGLRYTSLKGRSARVQAIFILGLGAILLAISIVFAWISVRF